MRMQKATYRYFTQQLMHWHHHDNQRILPWGQITDPYSIWMREIILQQTRTEQGVPYWEKFLTHYPTVFDLAKAPLQEVMQLWQGLGYYSRCRNLHATAQYIVENHQGIFPRTYTEIRELKGIGDYTAAAIASFAYNLPFAAVDGNVNRVLSRFFAIEHPIDSTEGKKVIKHLAQELIDIQQPSFFNQAIIDLGATICKPRQPLCTSCPLQTQCSANLQQSTTIFPIKSKKIKIKPRYFHYFFLMHNNKFYIQKREDKDIWKDLYEFYLIEKDSDLPLNIEEHPELDFLKNIPYEKVWQHEQQLSHQKIYSSFYQPSIKKIPSILKEGIWIENKHIKNYPFPRTMVSFLKINHYF